MRRICFRKVGGGGGGGGGGGATVYMVCWVNIGM